MPDPKRTNRNQQRDRGDQDNRDKLNTRRDPDRGFGPLPQRAMQRDRQSSEKKKKG